MKAYLGRSYGFCASHRLFRSEWDERRNHEVFGKCANPYGHGHNYTVEVLLGGSVDRLSGMVIDLVELDAVVRRAVIEPLDHTNLNLLPWFADKVPTSENLCIAIFERLSASLPPGVLEQVRIEETPNNSFTYSGKLAEKASKG